MSAPRVIAALCACGTLAAQIVMPPLAPLLASPSTGGGWRAAPVHRAAAGVWYLRVAKVVPAYAAHDLIATDDAGHFSLLSGYSGKWTVREVVPDGQWLAPAGPADVDPRVAGQELYAAGKGGNVHRITLRAEARGGWALDSVEIGHVPGEEFHALVAADVDPAVAGDELLVFGITGAVWQLSASGDGSAFLMAKVAQLPGRVRDTVVVGNQGQGAAQIFGVSRSGDLLAMELGAGRLSAQVVSHETSGLGRIATGRGADLRLYATCDDGVLLRFARGVDGTWQRAVVFVGDQGLRGVAAGRFHADGREAVAVYGYGKRVHIVAAAGDGRWQCETAYTGSQQGHWLAVGELDGRNTTDELVLCGFDGEVVLLARPAGHGLDGVAVAPDAR